MKLGAGGQRGLKLGDSFLERLARSRVRIGALAPSPGEEATVLAASGRWWAPTAGFTPALESVSDLYKTPLSGKYVFLQT